ncbi:type II toxin-antitoxin system PemK/MazF family toxin [Candidatus Dojkabacteria bacterium]|jgi:mRNA interferase MazF|nr:type II toxin-antitoxin system PemK/MazF family toxin [Candidatus Dojkabacteria bacterium]
MEYLKDFENWNILKKEIDSSNNRIPFFKEGDVWWVHLGANIGSEIEGKGTKFLRPMIIIRKYSPQLFLGIPLSSKLKNIWSYIPIIINTRKESLLITQSRSISSKRLLHRFGEISEKELRKVKKQLIYIIKNNPSG